MERERVGIDWQARRRSSSSTREALPDVRTSCEHLELNRVPSRSRTELVKRMRDPNLPPISPRLFPLVYFTTRILLPPSPLAFNAPTRTRLDLDAHFLSRPLRASGICLLSSTIPRFPQFHVFCPSTSRSDRHSSRLGFGVCRMGRRVSRSAKRGRGETSYGEKWVGGFRS